jgi:hypothetical protein
VIALSQIGSRSCSFLELRVNEDKSRYLTFRIGGSAHVRPRR